MYYLSLRKNLIGSRGVSKQLQCISQPRETCRLCRRMLTHTMWVKCLALHSDIAHLLFSSSIQPFPPSLLPSLPPSLHLPPSLLPPSFALSFPLSFPLSLSPSLILPLYIIPQPLPFFPPFLSSFPFCLPPSLYHLSVTFHPATLIWDRGTPERSWVHTANGWLSCRTLTQRKEGGAHRKCKTFCAALPLSPHLRQSLCQQHARLHFGMYFD